MKDFIKNSDVLYVLLDDKSNIVEINQSALNFYQWDKQLAIHRNFFDLSKECGIKTLLNRSIVYQGSACFKINKFFDYVSFFNKSNSVIVWNFDTLENGAGIVMLGMNITGNNFLFSDKNSSLYLKNIIDNVPHYIFWKDRQSVFLGCNKIFSDSIGLSDPKEVIGKTDYDLPWGDFEADAYRKDDQEVMETGCSKLHIEETQTTRDGEKIVLLTSKVPLTDDQKNVVGVLVIYTDISDRKKLESELIDAKASEARFKALSAMGGMIAHELRTPLTAIKGSTISIEKFLPVLLEAHARSVARGEMEPIRKDLLEGLGRSISNMNSLIKRCQETISAILTGIHHSTGAETPVLQKLMLRSIVENALANYPMEPTEQAKLSVQVENYPVQGSEQIIIHVLHNLLKNAFHIIHEVGRGEIRIFSEPTSDGIHLIVEDTAKGIQSEQLAHIFDAFYTTKEKTAQSVGLGLYFCRMALGRISAQIRCESKFGQYTRFIIVLPKMD